MDAVESAAVMKDLRKGIGIHLDHILSLLLIREQTFLPVPFPDDPTGLPSNFPHGDCVYTFEVQWDDAGHQVQHQFTVKLLHFRPEPGEPHAKWEIVCNRDSLGPQIQIGLLIMDTILYEDQNLFQITGSLVLWSLAFSVALTEPARIRKVTLAPPNAPHTVIQLDFNVWSIPLPTRGV